MLKKTELTHLLQKSNLSLGAYQMFPIVGGANHQLYRIESKNRNLFVMKKYFFSGSSTMALQREVAFLTHAKKWQIGEVAQVVEVDQNKGVALFSFLPGRVANPSDVNKANIEKCLEFFLSLNSSRSFPQDLPLAADAALCLNDYFLELKRRVHRLELASREKNSKEFSQFFEKKLFPTWKKLEEVARKKIQVKGLDIHEPFGQKNLCITPSDFGFHNVLVDGKKLYFVDFEHAGWDDPVSTVCDFFCQPKVPISFTYFPLVSEKMLSVCQDKKMVQERLDLVFPLYKIRWCCIMCNIFFRRKKEQRAFAKSLQTPEKQLQKAARYLRQIEEQHGL